MATNEELETRIAELESLIIAEYDPPTGSEYSFPVPGQPIDQDQFQLLSVPNGDGIIDRAGFPYKLVGWGSDAETNEKNSMILKVSSVTGKAEAVVGGYYHVMTEDKVIPLDPVSTTKTYYIEVTYDPRNMDDSGGQGSDIVSVQVYTSTPPITFNQKHVDLYTVTRKPNQLLTDAEVATYRQRISPTTLVYDRDSLPNPSSMVWGAATFIHGPVKDIVIAKGNTSDAADRYESLLSPDWEETPDGSSYVYTGSGYRVAIKRQGNTRELRGQWKRSTGQPFYPDSSYLLYMLEPGDRPKQVMRFKTAGPGTANGGTITTVTVAPNGEVQATPNKEATWLSLDGVRFDIK